MLFHEQPVNLIAESVESGVSYFQICACKSGNHDDALWQADDVMAGLQVICVDIHNGHVGHADGICYDRLGLAKLVAGGISLKFRRTGEFVLVVNEEAHKHLHGLVSLKLYGAAYDTCSVAVEYQRVKSFKLGSD